MELEVKPPCQYKIYMICNVKKCRNKATWEIYQNISFDPIYFSLCKKCKEKFDIQIKDHPFSIPDLKSAQLGLPCIDSRCAVKGWGSGFKRVFVALSYSNN